MDSPQRSPGSLNTRLPRPDAALEPLTSDFSLLTSRTWTTRLPGFTERLRVVPAATLAARARIATGGLVDGGIPKRGIKCLYHRFASPILPHLQPPTPYRVKPPILPCFSIAQKLRSHQFLCLCPLDRPLVTACNLWFNEGAAVSGMTAALPGFLRKL
ncbi:MAG: hypothetical protein RLZZ436_3121 [Planctomycetota bacterium]|jgi:hypothetical protein